MKTIFSKKYTYILASVLVIAIGLIIFSSVNRNSVTKNDIQLETSARSVKSEITLIAGNISLQLPIVEKSTLYQIIISARDEGKITVSSKEYAGLGFLITDIGELHQSGGKYLTYAVNGVDASVGVSTYVPNPGDVITWSLQ